MLKTLRKCGSLWDALKGKLIKKKNITSFIPSTPNPLLTKKHYQQKIFLKKTVYFLETIFKEFSYELFAMRKKIVWLSAISSASPSYKHKELSNNIYSLATKKDKRLTMQQ